MKAMMMTGIRQPLAKQDVPDPEPGPGQVRIRLHATGVCGTDVHVLHGELPVPLPLVLGHEPAGVIDATGPGVRLPKVGDRVGVSCSRLAAVAVDTAKSNKRNSALNRRPGLQTAAAMRNT